ncbi:MAG: O-antigen ligase domain-containing protein [Calditrichaeota bacterium]|nr:MAG: O-antigen ligase domain-containing protein [Calditrichota bacterium]
MSPTMLIGLGLLPLIIGISIILLGRDTVSNLKLLVVLIPLEAFAVLEIGFTITLAYLVLVIIILSIIMKGTKLDTSIIGGRLIILYWIIALISTVNGFFGQETAATFVSENMRFRASGMRPILQYGLLLFHFLLFFIVVKFVQKEKDAFSLLKIHLYFGLFLMCLGITQYVLYVVNFPLIDFTWAIPLIDNSSTIEYGKVRLYSAGVSDYSIRTTFIESLHFADYLNSVLPIIVAFWFTKSKEIKKMFGFLATPTASIIGILAMLLTFSRSGWGGFAIAMLILIIWLAPRTAFIHIPLATVGTSLIVVLLSSFGFFIGNSQSLFELIKGRFELENILFGPRAQYFLVLWDSFKEHPLLGLGAGRFALFGAEATGSDQVHSSHGILWGALADFGLLGFVILLAFMLTILISLYKSIQSLEKDSPQRVILIGIFAALCAVYFQSLFVGDRIQFYLVLLMGLSVVLINLYKQKTSDMLHTDQKTIDSI